MRILLTVRLPHESFNAAVKDGSVGPKMDAILEAVKPEAVYFTEMNGQRTVVMIVSWKSLPRSPRWQSHGFLPSMPMSSFTLS